MSLRSTTDHFRSLDGISHHPCGEGQEPSPPFGGVARGRRRETEYSVLATYY